MPIKYWLCPVCKLVVGLDHFTITACGLALHPDYAAAVLHSDDEYYGHDTVTVTNGLGCVRARAIERDKDVAVNPLDYNALVLGKAWDGAMERWAPADMVKIKVKGTIGDIVVEGEIDRVRRMGSELAIEDHKHSNNFQYAHVVKDEGPRTEYIIQTSIYAELYTQTFGERPTKGIVWYNFSGANVGNKPPLVPKIYNLMPLDNCLTHKPYGGDFTVAELYAQAALYYQARVTDAFDLPLAGTTMSFGTKGYCDYCQVRTACFENAFGAPF